MKKLMIMLALAVTTAAAVAETKTPEYPVLDYKTATEADYREVMNLIFSNPSNAYDIAHKTKFHLIIFRKDMDNLIKEIDIAYAEKLKQDKYFCICDLGWTCGKLPLMGKQYLQSWGLEDSYANTYEIVTRLKVYSAYASRLRRAGATLEDLIKVLSEYAAFPSSRSYMYESSLSAMKQSIQKLASSIIKRKLREQGKSFVTKNGVNPCEEYLTRLNAALDAPRFAGLNAWLEELGFEARINEAKMLSDEYIKELKEKIFYGEKTLTPFHKVILIVYLGVDGYNQFVKEYNGDK
jgi:hypothetical protein